MECAKRKCAQLGASPLAYRSIHKPPKRSKYWSYFARTTCSVDATLTSARRVSRFPDYDPAPRRATPIAPASRDGHSIPKIPATCGGDSHAVIRQQPLSRRELQGRRLHGLQRRACAAEPMSAQHEPCASGQRRGKRLRELRLDSPRAVCLGLPLQRNPHPDA